MSTKQGLLLAIRATLEQGLPSVREFKENGLKTCAYRGINNSKCTIGYLIPDKEYKEEMEGLGVHSVIVYSAIPKKYMTDKNWDKYFSVLQKCHDRFINYTNPSYFIEDFSEILRHRVSKGILPKYCLEALGKTNEH